uniref:Uncharacterized protein n=1 Tax=Ditylenchus dipsaci TaxID=166011 RepID=A0A915DDE6_9BILA
MRNIFVQILVHSNPPVHTARQLWDEFQDQMYNQTNVQNNPALRARRVNKHYVLLSSCFASMTCLGFQMPTIREQVEDYFFTGQQHLNDDQPDKAGPTPPPSFYPNSTAEQRSFVEQVERAGC